MSVLAFSAAKGSPGVTTSVLALAASWPSHREPLVVEADPAGGDLVARFADLGELAGLRAEPSTVQLAAAARSGLSDRFLLEHLQRLPGSGQVQALVAPSSPFAASGALRSLVDAGLVDCLSGLSTLDVLVDLGRLDAESAGLTLVRSLGQVVLVVRPRVASVVHTRDLATAIGRLGIGLSLLIVGESPYSPAEVATAVGGFPVVGVLADDRSGATALDGAATSTKAWSRSRLVRSAASVADRLAPEVPRSDEAAVSNDEVAEPVAAAAELSGAAR